MQYIQMSNVKNQQRRDLATMHPGTQQLSVVWMKMCMRQCQ